MPDIYLNKSLPLRPHQYGRLPREQTSDNTPMNLDTQFTHSSQSSAPSIPERVSRSNSSIGHAHLDQSLRPAAMSMANTSEVNDPWRAFDDVSMGDDFLDDTLLSDDLLSYPAQTQSWGNWNGHGSDANSALCWPSQVVDDNKTSAKTAVPTDSSSAARSGTVYQQDNTLRDNVHHSRVQPDHNRYSTSRRETEDALQDHGYIPAEQQSHHGQEHSQASQEESSDISSSEDYSDDSWDGYSDIVNHNNMAQTEATASSSTDTSMTSTSSGGMFGSLAPYVQIIPHTRKKLLPRKTAHNSDVAGKGQAFRCPQCSQEFSRKSNLRHHAKTHDTNRKRVFCDKPECGKRSFGRQADLTRHIKSAHEKQSHECRYCGKAYNRSDILSRHINDSCLPSRARYVAYSDLQLYRSGN